MIFLLYKIETVMIFVTSDNYGSVIWEHDGKAYLLGH